MKIKVMKSQKANKPQTMARIGQDTHILILKLAAKLSLENQCTVTQDMAIKYALEHVFSEFKAKKLQLRLKL